MGTPPPNQPGQYQGPYPPPDPRRQMRDYARAQREQMRAQRHYWKAYWRGGRRPSITGPIILVVVGVLALLVEVGRLNGYAIWDWYIRWWPLLLIGLGVVMLIEYFFDRGDPYAGRRVGGGLVFLIILFVVLGWGAHAAHWWRPFGKQFGMSNNDFLQTFGDEHDNDMQVMEPAAANGTVNVQNPRGDVTVTPSTDGQIHLQAHQVVHTWADDNMQKAFDDVKPQISSSGSGVLVTVPGHNGASVDLTLAIPEKSFLTVNAGHGDVSVEGLKNNVDVTDANGDVKFDGITGDVRAHMNDGDFSAHTVSGQVVMNGHFGDVTLSEIQGQAVMDGEFFGDTHLEQMSGAVHFHSSRTSIDLPKLGGELTLDSDDLTAGRVGGPARIETRSKDIELTQVAGDLHVEDSDGDVNVTAAAPLGNIEIENRSGGLVLTVPENSNFTVNASTSDDSDLQTDFPLQVQSNGDQKQMSGTVGSGSIRLNLTTTHGDLELRKGSAGIAPPPPPAPPAAPKGPVRHLRAPKTPVSPTDQ